MRRRGDGCGRGGGSGRRRPGREMRRGLPAPSDSSRVKRKGEDAHLVWSGSSGAGLVWALQAGFVTVGAAVGGG